VTAAAGEGVAAPLAWVRGGFLISTDPARLDLGVIHGFLSGSYWARGIPREVVERSVRGSLCFGLYEEAGSQVGFAPPKDPSLWMEIFRPDAYRTS
jgi:hypothetical protein